MKNHSTDVVLGILFFGVLIALGYVTIGLSDFALGKPRYPTDMFSPDVGYLRPGDPILLHGMPAGKVISVSRITDPVLARAPGGEYVTCTIRIETRLDVAPFELLASDHAIHIEDRGLLGGKLIRIEAGESTDAANSELPLIAILTPSTWQTAGAILEENRESIETTFQNLSDFSTEANSGDGVLGMLAYDAAVTADVRQFVDNLAGVSESINKGDGTLARLVNDGGLFDEYRTLGDSWNEITDGIAAGEGTVGRLIQDPELYDHWLDISRRIESGEGTVGQLINDDAVYVQLKDVLVDLESVGDRLADVTARIDAGEGVLGTLISDEELADQLREIAKQLLGAIEDARESAPVQEVGSLLFGTF